MEAKVIDHLEDTEINEVISNSLLFKGASKQVIDEVINNLKSHKFTKGSPIFLENELIDKVYFIKSGEVEIVFYQKDFNRMNQAAILKTGHYFAEFSVLTEGNTSASAIAHEDCEILSLGGTAFIQILRKYQAVAKNLAVGLGRMVSQFVDTHSYITYFNEDTIKIDNEVLGYLPMAQWKRLKTIPLNIKGNILCIASVAPYDQELIQFCNRHKNLRFEIHLINDDDFKIQLDSLTKKYQRLRNTRSTKVESKPEELMEEDKTLLKQTILNSNNLFSATPKEVKNQLLNYLDICNILPGQTILAPNIKVDWFHILVSGEISIFKEIKETKMLAKVSSIKVNDSFGLIPLLLKESSFLTAIATSAVTIVSIPKKVFTQLMGHAYFSIEVARNMAQLIQSANKHSGLENYDKKRVPDFKNINISIPLDIITRFQVLPLEQTDKQLTLGVVNPDGHLLYSTIGRYLVNLKVNVFILTEEQFQEFLPLFKKQYGNAIEQRVAPIKGKQNTVQMVNDIISEGTKFRASDVHIEPTGENLIVRYRVDGVLRESSFKIGFPSPGVEIISRLKILSKMDITNKLTPQDGQICEKIDGVNIFARVSAIPLKSGEKIVLRLIPEKVQVPPLISLTTDRELYQILQKVVKCRQGLFLITGPTGSGKTTTLYSLLHELNSIELNVVTVEDPVELEIPGINQIEINPKQNMTFEKALKAILRQDPDCIMIGEIRDKESARIALEAAMTGHLVLSTVHTPSSLDIIPRLRDLGVEKSLIASGLIGAMTQKLVRKNCSHCTEDKAIESEDRHFIEQYLGPLMVPHHLKKGKGCVHCEQTGYLGRIPIFEGWISSKRVQDMIVKEAPLGEVKQHLEKSENFHELAFNAMKLATLGQTTLEEVRRVLGLV